jgi:hypothetical protein
MTGVTLCKVKERVDERNKYGAEIFVILAALLAIMLLFSISLEIHLNGGTSTLAVAEFIQRAVFVIPFISIGVGVVLGIVTMSRRAKFKREL